MTTVKEGNKVPDFTLLDADGMRVMGIERSTFVINKEGKLVKEMRKVKVKGYVDEIFSPVR